MEVVSHTVKEWKTGRNVNLDGPRAFAKRCHRVDVVFVFFSVGTAKTPLSLIIIHQTHYEKSDWSRAFNQFTIACELDMINAISATDIAFIMSSSTSAWLPSPLECSPQKQNG